MGDVDTEIALMQGLIGNLRQLRDQSEANGDTFSSRRYDEILLKRNAELRKLMELRAEHSALKGPVTYYRELYDLLVRKKVEAELKENEALNASFIHIVEPARTPMNPVSPIRFEVAVAATIASLILGVFAAFLLEALAVARKSKTEAIQDRHEPQSGREAHMPAEGRRT
jgi:hypothetical protein